MEFTILKDIVIIFALSTFVNLIFTKFKIPTIIGYLITGIIAGPHLLSLIGSEHEIEIMAEIGVVLLLFTIGMEFSLKHLLRIRRVVFFGGLMQVSLTAGAFFIASFFYRLNWRSGLFIGFLAALSSSALVLKILQERSELTSNYGRTVLGILIFQDILLVPLILFTNVLGDPTVDISNQIISLSVKTLIIIGFVYAGNKWILPKLLHYIAMTKNQELFFMSILLICLGVALLTSELGMSLAFGAFLAGLMISESEYSHNAFGNLIPFKDTFTSFFFVSIGMLLDLNFITDNYKLVFITVFLVIAVKTFIAGGTGFVLGHTFRGTVMVGLALSQVGEFSFILAKIGMSYHIIPDFYYQLFLAVAVITMAVTPFFIQMSAPLSNFMLKFPLPKFWVNGLFPLKEIDIPNLSNHLVIIGKDPSAIKLSIMAKYTHLPHVSIIFDPALARERMVKGDTVVYGDAINEPVLLKAHVDTADIVVISIADMIASQAIIDKVRKLNKTVFILVRTRNIGNMEELYKVGADQVLPEKLEIAIDLFNRILTKRLMPRREINRILSHIRNDFFGIFCEKDINNKPSILDELSDNEICALKVELESQADGKKINNASLRKKTGVTLLALKRNDKILENPDDEITFHDGDIAYILGTPEQINLANEYFSKDRE